jgi:hypothetical protein
MTELLIVLALVAIVAIGVVSLFGDQLQELFAGKPPEARQQTTAATKAAPAPPPAPGVKPNTTPSPPAK